MECCQSSETKILKCLICKTCLCANHFQSHEHLINNIKIDISQVSPRNLDIFRRFLLEISIKTEEDYELMRREGIKIINRFENQSQKAVTLIENFENNVILLKNRIKSLKKNDSGYLVDENLKILMLRPSYLDKYLKNLYFFQIFNKNLDDLHIFTYTNSYDHHINLKQQHEISLKIIEIDRRKVMLNQIQQFYLNLTKKCPEFSKELLAILKETSIMTGNAYIVDSISLTRLIQTDKDLDIIIENNFQVFSHIFTLNSSLKRCEINNFLFIDKSWLLLFDSLRYMQNMKYLNLENTNLSNCIKSIASAFKNYYNLKSLNFNGCNISSQGSEALSELLKSLDRLSSLYLSSNDLGNSGVILALKGLKFKWNMKHLDISRNSINSWDSAFKIIQAILKMKRLEVLNMSDNKGLEERINEVIREIAPEDWERYLYCITTSRCYFRNKTNVPIELERLIKIFKMNAYINPDADYTCLTHNVSLKFENIDIHKESLCRLGYLVDEINPKMIEKLDEYERNAYRDIDEASNRGNEIRKYLLKRIQEILTGIYNLNKYAKNILEDIDSIPVDDITLKLNLPDSYLESYLKNIYRFRINYKNSYKWDFFKFKSKLDWNEIDDCESKFGNHEDFLLNRQKLIEKFNFVIKNPNNEFADKLVRTVNTERYWENRWVSLQDWITDEFHMEILFAKNGLIFNIFFEISRKLHNWDFRNFAHLTKFLQNLDNSSIKIPKILLINFQNLNLTSSIQNISQLLWKTYNLRILNLTNCLLKAQGAVEISRSLPSLKNLTHLMLGCNDIGDDGISDVVRGLISKQALVYLDLSSNSIKAEGILSVANVIQHLKNLEYLNLSNLIGSSASSLVLMNRTYSVGFVEGLMKNPNIYHLQINNFDLDETALNYLIDKLENMNNLAVLACGSLTVDCERRIKRAKDLIIYKQKVNRHENKIEMILI